jgi:hypothetical protein
MLADGGHWRVPFPLGEFKGDGDRCVRRRKLRASSGDSNTLSGVLCTCLTGVLCTCLTGERICGPDKKKHHGGTSSNRSCETVWALLGISSVRVQAEWWIVVLPL